MTEQLQGLKELLQEGKHILITTHQNPDGDAMGSSLALKHFLSALGHNVNIITPNDYPDYLAWMPGVEEVFIHMGTKERSKKHAEKADLIFCLDFNDVKRLNELGNYVSAAKADKILIDHHPGPSDFAKFIYHDTEASSTAELIYDFILKMGGKEAITLDIATCLYTGIMTDTGNFQYPSTTSKTLRVVAELIDAGVLNFKVYDQVYNHYSENRIRFFGHCITHRLRVFPEYGAAVIYITKEDQELFSIKRGDTEGLVNFPMQIKGIKLSALIVDRDDIVKLSLRSKGEFDVNKLARKYFNGGGHMNAAGGSSNDPIDKTVEKFIEILPEYKSEINQSIKNN